MNGMCLSPIRKNAFLLKTFKNGMEAFLLSTPILEHICNPNQYRIGIYSKCRRTESISMFPFLLTHFNFYSVQCACVRVSANMKLLLSLVFPIILQGNTENASNSSWDRQRKHRRNDHRICRRFDNYWISSTNCQER